MTSTEQQQTDAYYREAHWQMTQEAARLKERVGRLEAALARVEGLAGKWERSRDYLRQRNAPEATGRLASMDRREANAWDVAAHQIRQVARLSDPTEESA